MPYELILRPKSATPIEPGSLREILLAKGLTPRRNTCPPGLLVGEGHCLYEIVSSASEFPAGVEIIARIPYGLDYFDFTETVFDIQNLAKAAGCDMIFRNTPVRLTGDEVGLYLSILIGADYHKASQGAIAIFGVTSTPASPFP